MEFIITNWATILTLIFTIISASMVRQLKKEKAEIKKLEAEAKKIAGVDTSEIFSKMAASAGEQVLELYSRIDKLDVKVKALYDACIIKDNEIEILRDEIASKNKRIEELETSVSMQDERILELEREIGLLRDK